MKNFLSFSMLISCGLAFSQNTFPTGAGTNVGIGTGSPSTRLQLTSATSGTSGLRLTNLTSSSTASTANNRSLSVDTSGNVILVPSNIESSLFAVNTATSATSSADYLKKAQVFGAGSATSYTDWAVPITRYGFNVFDMYKASGYMAVDWILVNIVDKAGKEKIYFQTTKDETGLPGSTLMGMKDGSGNETFKVNDNGGGGVFLHMPKANSRIVIGNYGNYQPTYKLVVADGSALVEGNVISNGNIGIGTSSFTDGTDSYRLSVSGAIRAQRVKVYTTWADYVFNKDYNLPTLEEVEKHILEKGYLKDIPSEKEVLENGIELGEMNKLLLQKIEELTLYIIDMNKQLEEVKSQINKK